MTTRAGPGATVDDADNESPAVEAPNPPEDEVDEGALAEGIPKLGSRDAPGG